MGDLDVIITGMSLMIVIVILIGYFIIKHKEVKIKGGEILGVQFDIEEKAVDMIQVISTVFDRICNITLANLVVPFGTHQLVQHR